MQPSVVTACPAVAVFVVAKTSDTPIAGNRMKREDADVQRLEKILSKHGRKQSSEETQPRHSRSEDSVAEQPLNSLASESGMPTNAVREEVHHFPVFAACLCASGSPCSQPNDAACNASRVALRVTCTFAVPFQAQAQRQTGVVVEDLECSVLENALKEQVYRLTGQWQQGTALHLAKHDNIHLDLMVLCTDILPGLG